MTNRVSCFLVTGFLGSGKTTLLKGVLENEAFGDTAVIVNEFGEIGLDHDLIAFSSESTIVMPGGCICCTIREDIETSLRELFEARDAGTMRFNRIVIETTGIAEPVPLLMTLQANPLAQSRLIKPKVITVVDGVLGLKSVANYAEASAQVTSADVVVISKPDLAEPDELEALEWTIADLNPWARIRSVNLLETKLDELFRSVDVDAIDDLEAWTLGRLATPEPQRHHDHAHHDGHDHGHHHGPGHHGVVSHSIRLAEPLDWTAFGVWMTMLLHRHGAKILRVKGFLAVDRLPGPTLFQSAQHLVHPPTHMDAWPSDDRRSRIVFIVRDLDPAMLEASLSAFDRAARRAVSRRSDLKPAGAGGSIAGRPIRRPTAPAWVRG